MKRRIVGMFAAVLLASMGTLLLVTYVNGAEDRALAGEALVDVVVVDKAIPLGTSIDDVAARVRLESVPAKVRADKALASIDDLDKLEGKVTTTELRPGEQLLTSRFGSPGAAGVVRAAAPEGLLEVTLSLQPERAVGGALAAGDTVAVLASFEPFDVSVAPTPDGQKGTVNVDGMLVPDGGKTPNSTHLILHKVFVTNVQVGDESSGPSVGSKKNDDEDAPAALEKNLLVTLALPAASVEKVVFAAEHGFVWLAAEPVDAAEGGTSVLTRGSVYR